MSYCRWSEDSDVYVIQSGDVIECLGCSLKAIEATEFIFRRDAIRHLETHIELGHRVPESAIRRLRREIQLSGNRVGEEVGLPMDELIRYMAYREVEERE